jgi:hypothetical protein
VDCAKQINSASRKNNCWASAFINRRVSSAYCTIGKSSIGWAIGAWMMFGEAAWLIRTCNSSAASTKTRGDKGSPCLTPLLQLKNFPETPWRWTVVEAELRILVTQWIQLAGRPRLDMTWMIAWCSTKSKAFSKSSFKIMISLLDWWHWWRYSKHQARQSWMVLDLMKPYWFLWTKLIISAYNLSAIILVTSLGARFMREMGL